MKQIERINYLVEKYLRKDHSPEEGLELFELLKQVRNPESLDHIFRGEWNQTSDENYAHLLSWHELIQELDSSKVIHKKEVRNPIISFWKWTAAASILAIAAIFWWATPREPSTEIYMTGFGETKEIILDDGTKVTLNANSSLVWHLELLRDKDSEKYRLAELSGEAFFEVAHMENEDLSEDDFNRIDMGRIPFKVRTSDLTVNVLGTAFNVICRRGKTDVYLDRGSVQLELLKGQDDGSVQNTKAPSGPELYETLMMEPGDMVSFSSTTRDFQKFEAENPHQFTEWKEGTLVFDNVDFGLMLDRLEDIYGKKFAVEDTSLLHTPISAGVPYKNWEVVTRLLEVTFDVSFKEDQNNIVRLEKRKG